MASTSAAVGDPLRVKSRISTREREQSGSQFKRPIVKALHNAGVQVRRRVRGSRFPNRDAPKFLSWCEASLNSCAGDAAALLHVDTRTLQLLREDDSGT